VSVHGARHPELERVVERFGDVSRELTMHMYKEGQILFPYVRALNHAVTGGTAPPPNMFGTVRNPIRMMDAEHADVGNEIEVMRALTDGYKVPADGCPTYEVCLHELEAFEADLRRHIHLENNVLFPAALALETTMSGDHSATA
jgi:regulator of cell morphogenesis and NO signaling